MWGKHVVCYFPVKLSAAMSSRAPSSEFAVLWEKCSSFNACSDGSIPTLWQDSARTFNLLLSLIFCYDDGGKHPLGQLIACSTVKWFPQTQ